MPGGTAEG